MPIEDLEAKIKAVMAKSKTALAAQPAPAPTRAANDGFDARAAASAFAAAPPPPVAAAPPPPEPEPAALLDAVFGGDGDVQLLEPRDGVQPLSGELGAAVHHLVVVDEHHVARLHKY